MINKRTRDHHLPRGVYLKHGAYWFVQRLAGKRKWIRLAADYPTALVELAKLMQAGAPVATVETLWAKYVAEEGSSLAPKTLRNRQLEMRRVIAVFGHMNPREIKPHHIWEFWTRSGKNEAARHTVRSFSSLLSFGVKRDALDRNPCLGLRLPSGPPRSRYVEDAEYLEVRGRAPEAIGLAMDLSLLTGARQGDILRLARENITEAGIRFKASKTGKEQIIQWNEELRLTVDALLRMEPRVRRTLICTRTGHPYSSSGFQTAWQRLMRDLPKEARFTFHDLRAKSASDAGSDQEAADRLGHGDARMTRRVYRRLPARAKALTVVDMSTKMGS